ncbi:MAG: polysaccharide pyruvyl transferase family protein [Euryarchaeota archaeon]|nr:polysaccharide pyruvyl transferase family protein [Euryarchaeota archaeon]
MNAYSVFNRGDAGIVVATLQVLRASLRPTSIKVMSPYHADNEHFYSLYNSASIPSVFDLNPGRSRVWAIFSLLTAFTLALFLPRSRRFQPYHEADLIFSIGGGYLYSSVKGPLGIGLLGALLHIWIAKRLGKPIVLLPQSVGPILYKMDRLLVAFVLRRANLIITREHESTFLIKSLGISNVEENIDIAFFMEPRIQSKGTRQDPSRIGVTVLDWRFAHRNVSDVHVNLYVSKLADALFRVSERHSVSISIFPQVTVGGRDSDLAMSQLLRSECMKLGLECNIVNLGSIAPERIPERYSTMDVFIGSRMHSAIFALNGRVPTLGLAYQPKMKGTFETLGLQDFTFNIESFDPLELTEEICKIIEDGDYPWDEVSSKLLKFEDRLLHLISREGVASK